MTRSAIAQPQAALAFDQMAQDYDEVFTRSLIGRAQRDAVWNVLTKTFRSGDHILELELRHRRRRSLSREEFHRRHCLRRLTANDSDRLTTTES